MPGVRREGRYDMFFLQQWGQQRNEEELLEVAIFEILWLVIALCVGVKYEQA